MKYNFDEIINRNNTNSEKWDAKEFIVKIGLAKRFDSETIPLFIADMDFVVPQPVIDALRKRVDQKVFGYTMFGTDSKYQDSIINWFKEKYDWEIKSEEIVYSPGTVHGIDIALKSFSKRGEGVIIQQPVYSPFASVIRANRRKVVDNHLLNNDGYYNIDFEDLEQKAKDPNNTMMVFCSPHNPVGRIWTKDELKKVADICSKNDVVLISDEIHGDLIRSENKFLPIAKVTNIEKLITCTAVNKTFNLAGMHCSNFVIKDTRMRKMFLKKLGWAQPSPFSISALIAAYDEGDEWLTQIKEYLDANFDFLKKFLKDKMPTVKFIVPEGTYIAWLDFSGYNLSDKEIEKKIYQDANVILQNGSNFGKQESQFQRICIPTPKSVLETAMNRIYNEFKDLEK